MNTQYPLVSIIIPTYNRAHLIGETLDSVLAQTYQNWECIIVDDGSTDNTDAVVGTYVNKDPRFQYHHRPDTHKPGGNGARNYGFEVSEGAFLVFLDSDDLLENTCLENRCSITSEFINEPVVICIFKMGLLNNGLKTKKVFNKKFINEKESLKQFLAGEVPWTITSIFWTKNIFMKVGKFDESFSRLQDVDLHTRLLHFGIKLKSINAVDCWYKIKENTNDFLTEEKRRIIIKSHIKYIEKYYNYQSSQLLNPEEVNYALKKLYLRVLKKFVFKGKLVFFHQMKLLNKKFGFLTLKKINILKLMAWYHKFGLDYKYGYSRMRNKVFNS